MEVVSEVMVVVDEEIVVEDLLVVVEEVVVTCMIIIEEVQATVEVEVIIMDEEVAEEGARSAVIPMVVEVVVVPQIVITHVDLLEEGTTIHQEVVGEDITEVGEGEDHIEEAEDQVVEDHHLLQGISNLIIPKGVITIASNPISITTEEVVTVEDYLMMMEIQATVTTISTVAATT